MYCVCDETSLPNCPMTICLKQLIVNNLFSYLLLLLNRIAKAIDGTKVFIAFLLTSLSIILQYNNILMIMNMKLRKYYFAFWFWLLI